MSSTTHILVAHPDSDSGHQISESLKNWGWYTVHTANDLPAILNFLADISIDLVIMHIALAQTEAFAAMEYLRQNPGLRHVPIILLGELTEMPDIVRGVAYGEVDYLPLPLEKTLLRAKVISNIEKQLLLKQALSSLSAFNTMKKVAADLKQVILPLGLSLSAAPNLNQLLQLIVTEAQAICHADTGILLLRTETDVLRHAVVLNRRRDISWNETNGAEPPFASIPMFTAVGQPNQDVAARVSVTQQSANIPDIYHYEGSATFSTAYQLDELSGSQSTSSLTVPMKSHDVVGVLQLLNARDPDTDEVISFTLYHQQVLESLAAQAAVSMQNHILRRRQEELLHFKQELALGRRLQSNFLPVALPQPDGWELAAGFRPATEVGGDFYDAFHLQNGKVGLVIADVCDKGVAAAMFMSLVRTLIRAFAQRHMLYNTLNGRLDINLPPAHPGSRTHTYLEEERILFEAINVTNFYINRNHSQTHMFATLFFGILDPKSGQILYVNSGHPPPMILSAGDAPARFLKPTGPALGLVEKPQFHVAQALLHPGDTLLAYTDGVTDARNLDGEMFSQGRLQSLAAGNGETAVQLLQQIETAVQKHIGYTGQFDDIALLAARRLPPEKPA